MDAFDEFKFKMGDMVVLRTDLAAYEAMPKKERCIESRRLHPMLVVERVLQECYGGRQRSYSIRIFREGGTAMASFMEPELVAYVPPTPEKEEV